MLPLLRHMPKQMTRKTIYSTKEQAVLRKKQAQNNEKLAGLNRVYPVMDQYPLCQLVSASISVEKGEAYQLMGLLLR